MQCTKDTITKYVITKHINTYAISTIDLSYKRYIFTKFIEMQMLQNIWNVFCSYFIVFERKKSLNEPENSFKCGTVELLLCSFEEEIVLNWPNPEIIHTFKLFFGSVELFFCSFEQEIVLFQG